VQLRASRYGKLVSTDSRRDLTVRQVGHTGVYDAAVLAIGATDKAVKTVYDACEEAGYVLCITADHGNAEQMIDPQTGNPHTAHTTSKALLWRVYWSC